jgi:hypothetical protein
MRSRTQIHTTGDPLKITRMRVGAIATACALVGAGAGIAGSSAATSTSKSTAKTSSTKESTTAGHNWHRGFGPGGPGGMDGMDGPHRGGPPVHEEAVVLNKAGTAYITQTADSGLVKSVSGNGLVITEGTTAVPYKDVPVTIPSGATIMRNGKTATLADLKAGDHVVFAGDDTCRPAFGPGHDGRDGDHHGPPPAGAPAPPAPPAP